MSVDTARAKALFLEASELVSPEERTAYLDRACGSEPELRARTEALLAAHDTAGSFLGTPASALPDLEDTQMMPPAGSSVPGLGRANDGTRGREDDEEVPSFLAPSSRPDSL